MAASGILIGRNRRTNPDHLSVQCLWRSLCERPVSLHSLQRWVATAPARSRSAPAPQQVTGSPVIGGQTVYSLDPAGGVLYALNAATGEVRATLSVGTTSRFATPALTQSSIFIGTLKGVVAVSMH